MPSKAAAMKAPPSKTVEEAIKKYYAASGSQFSNADAAIIGPVLEKLERGRAEDVVTEARREDIVSPIAHYFPDRETCADRWELNIANSMINAIRVRIVGNSGESQEVHAFQRVKITLLDPDDERVDDRGHVIRVFIPFEEAQASEEIKADIIRTCYAEARSFRNKLARYRDVLAGEGPLQLVLDALDAMEEEQPPENDALETEEISG